MIFPTPMVQLLAVVLDRDVDKVTEELLSQGAMHFMNVTETRARWSERISSLHPKISPEKIADIRKRVESFLYKTGRDEGGTQEEGFRDVYGYQKLKIDERKPLNIEAMGEKLNKLSLDIEKISERQRKVQQEIDSLENIKVQFKLHGLNLIGEGIGGQYSFISIRIGALPAGRVQLMKDELSGLPSVAVPLSQDKTTARFLVVTLKRDTGKVDSILESHGWKPVELSEETRTLREDVAGDLTGKVARMQDEYTRLDNEKKAIIDKNTEELQSMWAQLRMNELFFKIQNYFRRTSKTVIFSGWLPAEKRTDLVNTIYSVTKGQCYIEWHNPQELSKESGEIITPPVQFSNPRIFKPFQMIVTNYGIPEYGTIDPTPFVAVSYLIMFGLMFADVCQGLILVLLGISGTFFLKGKKEGLQNISRLIIWCGLSSLITGVLFGSYFGMGWVRPLWFDFHGIISGNPHKQSVIMDIFDILTIALYFGIFVISMGLLFNWINLGIKRRWVALILEKTGLVGGWLYGGGIYAAWWLVSHNYRELPGFRILFLIVGLPAALLFLKHPVLFIVRRKHHPEEPFTLFTPMNLIMEGVVELIEVFSRYLSNTLSFLRVAGFGIAHVSLMAAFFELARMASGGEAGNYSLWSVLILICGNVLVIGLEGLSAGIQSLRLNYYEFFTKFFSGSGEIYSPVSLRSRNI